MLQNYSIIFVYVNVIEYIIHIILKKEKLFMDVIGYEYIQHCLHEIYTI